MKINVNVGVREALPFLLGFYVIFDLFRYVFRKILLRGLKKWFGGYSDK